MKKMANPYQREGWAIINPDGDVWGPYIFDTPEEAAGNLDGFWGGRARWSDYRYTVAKATCTVIVTGKERIKLK